MLLTGILPVLPTPFADAGVDFEAMRRVVRFALRAGVDGVVFPGFASEVETLTVDERAALLELVATEVDGRVPIVAGASAPTVNEVVKYGSQALALGIKRLMIQPPKSIGAGADAVASFLSAVAAQLPGAEIILQNAPAPRGSDLSPQAVLQVVRRVAAVRYVKEETLPAGPAITAILAEAPEHLLGVIGGGGARYILDEYDRGACAAMPALEIADLHVALDRDYRAGRRSEARALYVKSLPLLVLQAVYRMRLTKHVLRLRGVLDNRTVRAPTPDLDPFAMQDIESCFAECGLQSGVLAPERKGIGA
ncbi:dihydrodipicolinate synthase family protein [Sinorhizobium psoraleae]|uniref:Dihydrodipicolinate synthase family protein n=1 Tax=Sinorhizobium psoraleae TaxID=520838 RepID=A0ABT4KQR2_9HYPH|nr:dihydrodipicolinate synthase family protein [Sinorhizobium psoraleae]MCZ4094125.1 dihydrodipicolinate synthase family protein [Sinorhizobium psoraleae]